MHTLRLLGPVELRDGGGQAVALPTRRTALLLAMLVLDGERSRGELAAAVWEGAEPRAAREGLRTALSALRRALPEGAVLTEGDRVGLRPGMVCAPLDRSEDGEFMPGFESEWAIDRRLALRAGFVAEALAAARAARERGDRAAAVDRAARACALDPLDAEAASLQAELLREAGRAAEAAARNGAYRARVVRELGMVPEAAPLAAPVENPLVAAVEWTLARDSEEACALLAGTQNQWLAGSFEQALDVHQRVLAATGRPSAARRVVESSRSFFATMVDPASVRSGRLERLYREALDAAEPAASDTLCEALAYGNLSLGEFDRARVFVRAGLAAARRQGDGSRIGRWELHRGVLALHAGDEPGCFRPFDRAIVYLESSGSAIDGLKAQGARIGTWIHRGRLDGAAAQFDEYRRRIAAYGGERFDVWADDMEGHLHESAGDLPRAWAAYARFRKRAPAAGQCAVAAADDRLMRLGCALGEYDLAVDALARNVAYRRRKGSVPSAHERAANAPAVRRLRERLGDDELRAAFRRAAVA